MLSSKEASEYLCFLESARAHGPVSHVIMARGTALCIWTPKELDQMVRDGKLQYTSLGVEIKLDEEDNG